MSFSIGVVGAGQFASSFITLFQAHPDVSSVSVTDVIPERTAEKAAKHNLPTTYESFEQMLESDVDAVAIFTQRWLHGPMVLKALQAGKHVYSAVPMGMTVDEIGEIVDLVAKSRQSDKPLTYMMGETSYYYPSSVYCRNKLAAGEFGRVFYSEGDYVHDMDLGFYAAYQYSGGERWKETASFPPMHYPTHAIGNVLSVTGRHATAVSCIGVPDDRGDGVFDKDISQFDNDISNASALFRLDDGSVMRTNEMRRVGYPSHMRESRLRIFGTEGSFEQLATVSLWQDKETANDVSQELKTGKSIPLDDDSLDGVDPALRDAFVSGTASVHDRSVLPAEFTGMPNGHEGSHQFLANDFVRACIDGTTPPVNAWVAARYTLPGIVAHQSALQDGKQLEIPDFGDPIV
ncbi:MAG TPA: Gfo/Idh/MocA family oxidoreductase [Actinopolymorphaceae bacterium]|jgi:predicted dehydrogenase